VTTDIETRASEIEAAYRLADGCYLLGSLERGVTVYNQQVRAHNLAWALWERRKRYPIKNVAIVGGGIGGLTMSACLLSLFEPTTKVTIFERLWDLCPIQQGADGRWLHPRIYDWPDFGSRAPGASLPVLDWSEGRASDVARTVLREFGQFCDRFAADGERVSVYLGLRNFKMNVGGKTVDYVGTRSKRSGSFFDVDQPEGGTTTFDCIVLASGFGLESGADGFPVTSYWRNDQLAQPPLDRTHHRYLVSGFGDGALVDLCRLRVERYRQDTILYELFGKDLETVEEVFRDDLSAIGDDANIYELLSRYDQNLLVKAKREISNRVRKDTSVDLHIAGKDGQITRFSEIFGRRSSVLNRVMAFLLYRCGAFSLSFEQPREFARKNGVARDRVLCRYGADTLRHLRDMIADYTDLETRLAEMKDSRKQVARRLWRPGVFPNPGSRID
jgi:hypothetical protein